MNWPPRSLPCLKTSSERNSALFQSPWYLLNPKLATVRALASVLRTKHQTCRIQLLQFSNSSFPFSPTSPQTRGSSARRSIPTVPFPVQYGRQRSSSAAGGVPAPVKHDMQGDAVAVASVDMGTHRGVLRRLEGMGEACAEAQGPRGCFTRGSGSGYECEVLLSLYLSLDRG